MSNKERSEIERLAEDISYRVGCDPAWREDLVQLLVEFAREIRRSALED